MSERFACPDMTLYRHCILYFLFVLSCVTDCLPYVVIAVCQWLIKTTLPLHLPGDLPRKLVHLASISGKPLAKVNCINGRVYPMVHAVTSPLYIIYTYHRCSYSSPQISSFFCLVEYYVCQLDVVTF